MEKKYRLTDETINIKGITLYRIEALKDFSIIKKGDKGGFVQSEDNLSHERNCWVCENAKVYGRARIYGNAIVGGNAEVYGFARIYDNSLILNNAQEVVCQ